MLKKNFVHRGVTDERRARNIFDSFTIESLIDIAFCAINYIYTASGQELTFYTGKVKRGNSIKIKKGHTMNPLRAKRKKTHFPPPREAF